MIYIKKIINQDLERTPTFNVESIRDFFKINLDNLQYLHKKIILIPSNEEFDVKFQKRATRDEYRVFLNDIFQKINPVEGDILILRKQNQDVFLCEHIDSYNKSYDHLNHLFDERNNHQLIIYDIENDNIERPNQPLNLLDEFVSWFIKLDGGKHNYFSDSFSKNKEKLKAELIIYEEIYKNEFVQGFVDYAPGIIHIDIPGGEPFLSGVAEQKQLLAHYIQTGQAKDISIHYTTNVTIHPDSEWWDLWQHFKEIDMQLSIDGVGQRYEYIRYPADWNTVLKNVNQYLQQQTSRNNLRLSVSHTVSAYNIYYLDEFVSWCYTIGLPRPWIGRVHNPNFMRPSVWPKPVRDIIISKLTSSKDPDVKQWAELIRNTDDSNLFSEFKEKMQKHDEYRALSFAQTFSELANYI
jgi:hypothetical protein